LHRESPVNGYSYIGGIKTWYRFFVSSIPFSCLNISTSLIFQPSVFLQRL